MAIAVSRQCRRKAHRVDKGDNTRHGLAEISAQPLIGYDGKRTAEPRHIVSFAGCHQRNGAIGEVIAQGRGGNVGFALIQQKIAMNLIGTDNNLVFKTNLAKGCQLLPGKYPSHRVVGIAKDEKSGARGNGTRQALGIKVPAAICFYQGNGYQVTARISGGGQKRRVNGNRGHDVVMVVTDGATGHIESAYQPRYPNDPIEGHGPPEAGL